MIAAFLVRLTKLQLGLEDRSSYCEARRYNLLGLSNGGEAFVCSEDVCDLSQLTRQFCLTALKAESRRYRMRVKLCTLYYLLFSIY